MREIKFRGKRIDNGEWAYGSLVSNLFKYEGTGHPVLHIVTTESCKDCVNSCDNEEEYINCEDCFIEVDPATIGQYTGHESEAFEGDILHIEIKDHLTGKVIVSGNCAVEYHNSSFGVRWGYNQEFTRFDGFGNTTFEVIGNIHEDGGLLDGE